MKSLRQTNYHPARSDYSLRRFGAGDFGGSPWQPSARSETDSPVLRALIVAAPPAIVLWTAILWGAVHLQMF